MSSKGISHRRTSTFDQQCPSCKFWYEWLHRSLDGRDLCRLCLELSGENRSRPPGPIERSAHPGRVIRVR